MARVVERWLRNTRKLRWLLVSGLFVVTLAAVMISHAGASVDLEWEGAIAQPPATLNVETLPTATPYVWWEAEAPTASNFPARNPFAPSNFPESVILSGGEWIGVDGTYPEPPYLAYDVTVPASGDYYFYSRRFWKHGPFRWRWDDQDWQSVEQFFLMDSHTLRPNVVVNWVPLGQVRLAQGPHTLRIELLEDEGAAAFDCFVLSQAPMRARGKLKPDQRYTAEIPGWFLFDPDDNPATESVIDLRSLNEPYAGAEGWIQAQAGGFVHGTSGTPVRFWGVNVGPDVLAMDDSTMAQTARFWARQGVNVVRFHGRVTPNDRLVLDGRSRDRLLAWVNALKQEGIYTGLSLYFPLWYRFPDLGYAEQRPFGLMFWNAELQQQYRTLWRDLLQRPLPGSTTRLGQDPALAFVELVNEDSVFFWTFDLGRMPEQHQDDLAQQFGRWLTERYGSVEAALGRWGGEQDDVRRGGTGVAVVSAWQMASQPNQQRIQDTVAFLGDRQRQFFQQTRDYLKQDLGYPGMVVASNWITADPRRLGPLDKYTNTVGDFMDRHGYFEGHHEGDAASYAVRPGNVYRDQSALLLHAPLRDEVRLPSLPIFDIRYNDKPSTISELNWSMPNRFRADFPVLAAAYGSLHNTDGFFFFATNQPGWDTQLEKFSIASPVVMGQFPATAWLYRQGLLQPGEAIATVERPVSDILALRGTPLVPPQNLDTLREADVPEAAGTSPTPQVSPPTTPTFDPMAFLVGPVDLRFTDGVSRTEFTDLEPFGDRRRHRIHSITQQLTWDYEDGVLAINAPQVQGATGFLKHARRISLDTVTLQSTMPYGSILLVSFDGQPLARSRKMLLQVMSADENFGWRTNDDNAPDRQLLTPGTAPLVVQTLEGTVSFNRPDAGQLIVTHWAIAH